MKAMLLYEYPCARTEYHRWYIHAAHRNPWNVVRCHLQSRVTIVSQQFLAIWMNQSWHVRWNRQSVYAHHFEEYRCGQQWDRYKSHLLILFLHTLEERKLRLVILTCLLCILTVSIRSLRWKHNGVWMISLIQRHVPFYPMSLSIQVQHHNSELFLLILAYVSQLLRVSQYRNCQKQ